MSGDVLGSHNSGTVPGIRWLGVRGAAEQPAGQPYIKDLTDSRVSSTKIEDPCYRQGGAGSLDAQKVC